MAKRGDISIGTSWGELGYIIIASLFIGFAISYRNWGIGSKFIASVGIINLIAATIICAFSLWFRTNMQKRAGRKELATVKFNFSIINLIYSFFITIITNGFFVFAASGRPKVESITHLRPGYMDPHLGAEKVGGIVGAGIIASLALIVLAKIWIVAGGGLLATYLFRTNIWIVLVSLVPLPAEGIALLYQKAPITSTLHQMYPPLARVLEQFAPRFEGEQLFFGSRPFWFFITSISVVLIALLRTNLPASSAVLWAIVLGSAAVVFWFYLEYKKFKVKLLPSFRKKK